MDDLMAARRADDLRRAAELRGLQEKFMARVEFKVNAAAKGSGGTRQPTIDVLVISGGGDWGAFGAGVLKGWGRVTGELARPQFDVVTGVSTGALIAPFAFLGDDASIDRIVHLYRNPREDTAVSRGLLFFLPNNPSFYLLPGLERELRIALDRSMIERVAAQAADSRVLLVNTTNIDLGDLRVWDIGAEARTALASNDEERVRTILLASAGVPAVFPARGIGDFLYVDGAITGNIIYAGRTSGRRAFRRNGRRSILACRCRASAIGSSSTISSAFRPR
jgi:predicted acylesterase/phospholipase RssA